MSNTTRYADMDTDRQREELDALRERYAAFQAKGLALNMARGKPAAAQLDLSTPLLTQLSAPEDCFSEDGTDCRNYGVIDGIPEAKRLMALLLDDEPDNVFVFGNACYKMGAGHARQAIEIGHIRQLELPTQDTPDVSPKTVEDEAAR